MTPPERAHLGAEGEPRKYTYARRKEERRRLDEQISTLSKQLRTLRRKKHDRTAVSVVAERVSQNAVMRGAIDSHKQTLWGAHMLLSNWMSEQFENPLSSHIHLTSDFNERRRTLLAMRPRKLDTAERFLCVHCEHLDLLRPYSNESRFENAQGDQCATRVEVMQFDHVKSVKEVLDAVLFSIANIEIAVSEKLGHLTLREDYDTLDNGTWNARLLSSDAQGVRHEMNAVTFYQLRSDHYASGCEFPGCGLITADFVDKDDLYPYHPSENLRRDISVVFMATPHRRPKASGSQEEVVVVLQHVVFERVHHSELVIHQAAIRALRNVTNRWGDIIIDGIHDQVPDQWRLRWRSRVQGQRKGAEPSGACLHPQCHRLAEAVAVGSARHPLGLDGTAASIDSKPNHEALLLTFFCHSGAAEHAVREPIGFIHLTSDQSERRQTLPNLKPRKLEAAERFLSLHTQELDVLQPYVSENRFKNAQGDHCVTRIEVEQFEGVASVKDVFDALVYSDANLEISVTEKLGDITLREDSGTLDDGVWNSRLLSRDTHGTQNEMNCVTFAQFQTDRVFSGCESPGFGILVTDFVDQDDLYPYQQSQSVRRDISVVCMLTPHRRPRRHASKDDDQGELVVVLQHLVFKKLHHSELPIGQSALRALRHGTNRWGDVPSTIVLQP